MSTKGPGVDTVDMGYRDSLTKIEPYGVDHIPSEERHGTAGSQFFIWFAAGMNFPIMVLGFSATYFGLSLVQAITALLVGTAIGAFAMGALTRMGVNLGIPQQMQARGPLGFIGNLPPVAYVNIFAGIGWASLTVILAGKAFSEIAGLPFFVIALGMVGLQFVVCLIGYNLIQMLQRILTVVLILGFLLITVVSIHNGGGALGALAENPQAPGFVGTTGGWITYAGYFLAYMVAWLPFASDYSRYLPNTQQVRRSASIYTFFGNFLTLSWMGIVGVILASVAKSSDPIVVLHNLMGAWAIPGLLTIVVSSFSQNFLNFYGGAISIQTMGLPVKRTTGVAIMCIVTFFVANWAYTGVYTAFTSFLNLTSYFIAPYITVLMCDYYSGRRTSRASLAEVFDMSRKFEWGFVAWLVGVLGSSVFWVSPIYTGPLAHAFPQVGDLSMYVAAFIALIVYFATYRLPPLSAKRGAVQVEGALDDA